MTDINGEKRRPLGSIDNFEITVGTVTTKVTVDVTSSTVYSVIVGNDWLRKIKANIDYSSATITIKGERKEVKIPCTFVQDVTGRRHAEHSDDEENEFDEELESNSYLFGMHNIIGN